MFAICRIEKLKTTGNIGGLNSHLTRTMDVPNSDKDLAWLNHRAVGSLDLNLDIQKRLDEAKIVPRKNAVLAVEHLLTASPEYFKLNKIKPEGKKHNLQGDVKGYDAFKTNAIEWLNERYGKENVVNVTIHLDETTPHIHAIVVPIDSKGKLNARSFFGGRDKMREMQDNYAAKMKPLGLIRGIEGSKAQHTSIKEFYGALKTNPNQIEAIRDVLSNRKRIEVSKLVLEKQALVSDLKAYKNTLLKINDSLLKPNGLTLDKNDKGFRKLTAEELEKSKSQNLGRKTQ